MEQPAAHTPVHIRNEPHLHTLAVRGRVDEENFAQFLDAAYSRLGVATDRLGVATIGLSGACTRRRSPTTGTTTSRRTSRSPVRSAVWSVDGVVNSEVPAARVAVLVHAGGYDTIADTYRSLGAWVAEHADPLPIAVREDYVVSYGETDDTERFRTEIHWPINDRSNLHEPQP